MRESLCFSNILNDLFKLLFRVHVELHPRLHRGKLKEKEQGVKRACVCEATARGREQRAAAATEQLFLLGCLICQPSKIIPPRNTLFDSLK